MPWLKRFSLHLAAAVGATGIFVAAAVVGANQAPRASTESVVGAVRTPAQEGAQRAQTARPTARRTATPRPSSTSGATSERVIPERSLAGKITEVDTDSVTVLGTGGHEWHIAPAPGALIRLNGKPARLDALQASDSVVVLGQAQPGPGSRFLAHAITARRK